MANTNDILYLDDIIQDMKYFDETNYVKGNQKVVLRNIWFWSYWWVGMSLQADIHWGIWIFKENVSCGFMGKKHGQGWEYFIIHGSNVLKVPTDSVKRNSQYIRFNSISTITYILWTEDVCEFLSHSDKNVLKNINVHFYFMKQTKHFNNITAIWILKTHLLHIPWFGQQRFLVYCVSIPPHGCTG